MQYSFKEQLQQISPSGSFAKNFKSLIKFTCWKDAYWKMRDGNPSVFYFFTMRSVLDFLITRLENLVLLREPKTFFGETTRKMVNQVYIFS